ncbi:MAG TPA: hypothetical protein VFW44_15700 [Bryobacteraceae bacterium]|nr:hypothetical protein [Bryobacteraceae bacterium]
MFGREPDYDPRVDPVVRVQARLLRFKLHEYHVTAGQADNVRIDLPKGSYLAAFSRIAAVPTEVNTPATRHDDHSRAGHNWLMAVGLVAIGLLVVAMSVGSWRDAVGKVWAKTLPSRPKAAQSPAADLYLKGRYYWNKRTPEDLQKALDYFTQSIVADAGYARAYVGLADCYGLLREYAAMPDTEAWPRALAAARRAVELDDSLAEAHSTLGFDLFYGTLDLKGGERELKRGVELNPNYAPAHQWYATALLSVGRFSEASEEMARARELDPASRSILSDQGLLLYYEGKKAEAIEQLRQVEAAEPAFRSAHTYLAFIYFESMDCDNFLLESRKAAELAHDSAELELVQASEVGYRAGGWQAMLENRLRAEKKLAGEGRCSRFRLAEASALLGKRRDALDYLQDSYKNKEVEMTALAVSSDLSSLRREPLYQRLIGQLGVNAPY